MAGGTADYISQTLTASLGPAYALNAFILLISVLVARFTSAMDRMRRLRDLVQEDDIMKISIRLREVIVVKTSYALIVFALILVCISICLLVTALAIMFFGARGQLNGIITDYEHYIRILFLNGFICYIIPVVLLITEISIACFVAYGTMFVYIDNFIDKMVEKETAVLDAQKEFHQAIQNDKFDLDDLNR